MKGAQNHVGFVVVAWLQTQRMNTFSQWLPFTFGWLQGWRLHNKGAVITVMKPPYLFFLPIHLCQTDRIPLCSPAFTSTDC